MLSFFTASTLSVEAWQLILTGATIVGSIITSIVLIIRAFQKDLDKKLDKEEHLKQHDKENDDIKELIKHNDDQTKSIIAALKIDVDYQRSANSKLLERTARIEEGINWIKAEIKK